MSTVPPAFPQGDHTADASRTEVGKGLAITSVICGAIGVLISPLGLVALILGIIAIVKISKPGHRGPRGLAITGTVLGGIGLLLGCLLMPAILLPALGKARQSARQLKSGTQMKAIVTSMHAYAATNKDWFPPKGSDWRTLITQNGAVTQGMLESPFAEEGQESYFYVAPGRLSEVRDPQNTIVLVENPEFYRGRGGNVAMADGSITKLEGEHFWSRVEALEFEGGKRLRRGP